MRCFTSVYTRGRVRLSPEFKIDATGKKNTFCCCCFSLFVCINIDRTITCSMQLRVFAHFLPFQAKFRLRFRSFLVALTMNTLKNNNLFSISKANSRHFSSQNISAKQHCPSLLICVCVRKPSRRTTTCEVRLFDEMTSF